MIRNTHANMNETMGPGPKAQGRGGSTIGGLSGDYRRTIARQPGGDPRMAQKVVRCKEAATLKVDVEGALFVL